MHLEILVFYISLNIHFQSLPEQLQYWPAIIATDVIVSSKGMENTVGAVLIPNSKKYLNRDVKIKCGALLDANKSGRNDRISLYVDNDDSNENLPLLGGEEKSPKHKRKPIKELLNKLSKITSHTTNKKDKDVSKNINYLEYNWWTKFYNTMSGVSTKIQLFFNNCNLDTLYSEA